MNTIQIQSRLDVTSARNLLRKKITGGKWLPPLRARAATALTLLGELILDSGQMGTLSISILSKPGLCGIEIECTYVDDGQDENRSMHQQLARIVDHLDITPKDGYLNLKTSIWLS